jgi:hypothetical protein
MKLYHEAAKMHTIADLEQFGLGNIPPGNLIKEQKLHHPPPQPAAKA